MAESLSAVFLWRSDSIFSIFCLVVADFFLVNDKVFCCSSSASQSKHSLKQLGDRCLLVDLLFVDTAQCHESLQVLVRPSLLMLGKLLPELACHDLLA
jgi:hypothetical protein